MTPHQFFESVAEPNIEAALTNYASPRDAANAVLSLDALIGIIYAELSRLGDKRVLTCGTDDQYRDALAAASAHYRVVRDLAAALKHGELDSKRKPRLVLRPDQMRSVQNQCGIMQCGDSLASDVLIIQIGNKFERASTVIGATYRLAKEIMDTLPHRTNLEPSQEGIRQGTLDG